MLQVNVIKMQKHVTYSAFSLVELTMALAICTLAIVALVALIPMAVHTHKISNDVSVASLIAREIVAKARQADYDTFVSAPNISYKYFDNEGFETSRSRQVYTAELQITRRVDVPGPNTSRTKLNDFARLRIRVAKNPLGRIANDANVFNDPNLIVHTSATYIGRKESVVK